MTLRRGVCVGLQGVKENETSARRQGASGLQKMAIDTAFSFLKIVSSKESNKKIMERLPQARKTIRINVAVACNRMIFTKCLQLCINVFYIMFCLQSRRTW